MLQYANPMAANCLALGRVTQRAVRRPVPRRADHARPDCRLLRHRRQARDHLHVRRHQPHGLVPAARTRGPRPLSGAAREVREARVLQEREGPRRGLPPLRLLHDRVDRAPQRVRALVPQEPGRRSTSTATSRRSAARAAPTTSGARPWPRSTPRSTRCSSRRPPRQPQRRVLLLDHGGRRDRQALPLHGQRLQRRLHRQPAARLLRRGADLRRRHRASIRPASARCRRNAPPPA